MASAMSGRNSSQGNLMMKALKGKMAKVVTKDELDELPEEEKIQCKMVRHGYGVEKYADGKTFYAGQWSYDERNGEGR